VLGKQRTPQYQPFSNLRLNCPLVDPHWRCGVKRRDFGDQGILSLLTRPSGG
jgi:hypothetical protein